jgi:ATP-dependent helicase/nuclease subunit A
MSGLVHPLKDNQMLAVDPRDSVWLSASAGTGKTQVLSARVLRLLLTPGVLPDQILCLTFTKAGAAEMANRVNAVLASWVRMDDLQLFAQLDNIGAATDDATKAHARSLFASVLDCPGGGLRIDTIHAFSQWLLANFPEEAGLEPGTRPMEDRDRELLLQRVLSDLLDEWTATGDAPMIAAMEALSLRLNPDGARRWLDRCASARAAWEGPGAWQPPMMDRVRRLLGMPVDASAETLAEWCADGTFDTGALRQVSDAYHSLNSTRYDPYAAAISAWLGQPAPDRLAGCRALIDALFNKEGQLKYIKNIEKADPGVGGVGDDLYVALSLIADTKALLDYADFLAPALEVGRRYSIAWEEAKAREGLVDFDDLIARASALLTTPGLGEWIRYKLDRSFDHILIDEAQDTNGAQWSIVNALTEEYFAGLGLRDNRLRTIFVVGDYKQAIFRFQGTSPENFDRARVAYRQLLEDRAANIVESLLGMEARSLVDVGLGRSYRTAQDVLDFVNRALDSIGHAEFGLREPPEPHVGDKGRSGLVTLWQPIAGQQGEGGGDDFGGDDGDGGEEGWISAPERRMADAIAAQVRGWMDHGFPLVKDGHRNAGPGDVMVLVRKRRELAGLIVARLHAAGVPVAGVDRLRLGAPLAVKDLMAALRFAAQPGDSLSLAALLVSPIFGWTQQDLLDHGYRGGSRDSLWDFLRAKTDPLVAATCNALRDLLAIADFEPPQALLHWMLVGPWQARARLVARLGGEANDPIDELLNAALAHSASYTPSLQGFIHWFDAGEGELKRDPDGAGGQVRVMTVHGSKGLQAPIVILADATGDPSRGLGRNIELAEDLPGLTAEEARKVPVPDPRKEERSARLAEALEQASLEEMQEHWRLLYVAMTRAEEALFIGGALGKREKAAHADSWFARLEGLFGDNVLADPVWGGRRELGRRADPAPKSAVAVVNANPDVPPWAKMPIGPEPRPPRPLAPSSLGEEQGADPPLPAEVLALAARRGVLMHSLLQRLPDVAPDHRETVAHVWLARQAGDFPPAEREDMAARAIAVLANPDWADLFGPLALAEVPLAATVEGQVIAGTADRLLIEESRVLVADFKTARRPPQALEQVPDTVLRQMAAYAAALAVIFPGKAVEAAVLYTQTPQLFAIPADVLDRMKPGFGRHQDS